MSLQLLNEVSNNYQLACAVHRELADTFWFISMPGYALWNEYQLLDESLTQRKIKRYISQTYHTYAPDIIPESANIAGPLLGNKNRLSLTMDGSWQIIKESFRIYQEWEESTLKLYQQIAAKLHSNGEISAFNFVGEIIRDVKTELDYVNDKCIELAAMSYDMPQIVAEQPEYYERFEYLIKQLLGKSEKYHYHNSARDPQSKVLFAKYPGE